MIKKRVVSILNSILTLEARDIHLELSSALLGAIPELDSMAVVGIITALEDEFGFTISDDEISADCFETLGSLVDFVNYKLNG